MWGWIYEKWGSDGVVRASIQRNDPEGQKRKLRGWFTNQWAKHGLCNSC